MADATPIVPLGVHAPRPDGGFLWESIVTGPVRSRRLGVSLGLNLLPARSKACSFDCPYCECGRNTPRRDGARWPSPDEVAHALRRALERLPAPPQWITFSGNGEPTLHPRFGVVVDRVLEARDELAREVRVAVLSNGLAGDRPAVRDALRRVDARILKLDPGPAERVNGAAWDAERLVSTYRALAPVVVQAMVVRGDGWDGAGDASVAAWVELLTRVSPAAVQIYSLARPPADATVRNVSRERLLEMATAVEAALPRCDVQVF
jgi:wyosine [tRNA(Phe)-imidazoG37] synthetase (radical SAM superfamily)